MNILECELALLKFPNPLILASGILGVTPGTMIRLAKLGIGGITTKSVGPKPRKGYKNPSIIEIDSGTLLNSVGLANPGIDAFSDEIREIKNNINVPLVVSIFGTDPGEYALVAKKAEIAGADAIEINISCPHAEVASIGLDTELTYQYTHTVKKVLNIPLFVKLTPNLFDLRPIALSAQKAGADAIVAINTVRGLAIDPYSGRPLLSHGIGGISGSAIRPIGVRAVYELSNSISIPIIGCGGISKWQDVLEYIYAGATAVQIGSVFISGLEIIQEILQGLSSFLKNNNIVSIRDIKGKSHQYDKELEVNPE